MDILDDELDVIDREFDDKFVFVFLGCDLLVLLVELALKSSLWNLLRHLLIISMRLLFTASLDVLNIFAFSNNCLQISIEESDANVNDGAIDGLLNLFNFLRLSLTWKGLGLLSILSDVDDVMDIID